ncbi:MAG TPA: hypothetical protein VGE29_11980, partial [Prosthecobacter sp.]
MEELNKRGCPHLYIALDSAGFLCTEKDVMENLWKHMINWEGLVKPDHPWQNIQGFFDWLDAEHQRLGRHICLLLGNFGRIAEPLASRFLTLVRGAHDSGWLALGICGESNVTDLVHGAGSSYQCDHFYVLQGVEREIYIEFYERTLARLHLNIADKDKFVDVLYQKTAGDMRLLRHTLHAFSMQRRTEPILDTDLPDSFLDFEEPRIWSFEAFGPLQKLAEALKREDLMLIRSLVGSSGACMLPPAFSGPHAPPHALELMGLVNRQPDGVTLKFSSSYMEKFARDYFNSVQLGDLFARAQDWKSAFACYAEVTQPDLLLRPYSPADFSTVRHLVEGLCGEMHRRVAQAPTPGEALGQIQNLAVQGCRLLLGHAAVSLWERHPDGWRFLKTGLGSGWEVEDPRAKNILEIKGAGMGPGGTVQFLSQDRAHFAVVETPDGRRFAIVVADWDRLHLPTLQQSLTEQLLEDFSIAWRHAANVAFTENRLKEHLQIMDTTNEVFAALGKEITDVPGALESIGRKLLQVRPFTRVAWLLKKPGENTLRLVNEETSGSMSPVFPGALEVSIDGAGRDLEANCFAEALRADTPFVISDPQSRSLLPAAFRQRLKGLCYVLGLRDETGETVGAFFLEQQEGIMRSHDLKHDLSSLARRVAIVIGQAERTAALQKALDGIRDPIIIVDTDDSLRFANAPASRLLQLDDAQASRWLPKKKAMYWKSTAPAAPFNAPALKEAPKDRENNVSFNHHSPSGNEIMWNATLFPLKDWLGLDYCHVECLRDRTTITKALDALYVMGTAANASECLDSFFKAASKVIGKKVQMVLLYLVDPDDSMTLISHRAIGFKSENKSVSFEKGKVRLNKDDCPNAWKTFENVPTSRPVCWKWDPDGEEGTVLRTPKGLEYIVTRIGSYAEEL